MVINPMADTEPRVQPPVMGHSSKGLWAEKPTGAGFCGLLRKILTLSYSASLLSQNENEYKDLSISYYFRTSVNRRCKSVLHRCSGFI